MDARIESKIYLFSTKYALSTTLNTEYKRFISEASKVYDREGCYNGDYSDIIEFIATRAKKMVRLDNQPSKDVDSASWHIGIQTKIYLTAYPNSQKDFDTIFVDAFIYYFERL